MESQSARAARRAATARRSVVLVLWLGLAWLLWSGRSETWLLGLGALSCALVLALTLRFDLLDEESEPVELGWRPLVYVPWLLWQVLKANLHVMRVIVAPRLRVAPQLVSVKATQRTVVGQVIHAQSITLTPGTLSLDLRDGRILVHALTDEDARGLESGDIDRMATWLEGGER